MFKAHRTRAALATLAAAGMLVGCGGPEGRQTALKPIDINPLARDDVRQGGTLRLAIEQFSTQWNNHHVNGGEASTSAVLGGMLPSPFRSDERANLTVDPDYVTSARVTATSPRQVVTYRLNPRARWSTGDPITWRDYEGQWRALRSAEGPYQIVSSTGYERIGSVRQGRDPYEVVVTFNRRYSEWQGLFGGLLPAETTTNPRTFNTGWVNRIPVTAGPFKLAEMDRTRQTVTIVRDPNWWGKPAKLDSIVFRAMAIDASINAFVNGEIDAVDVGPDPSHFRRVQRVPESAIRRAAGPDFRHITFNGASPALRDVRVRQAVAMAIDRETLARADLAGLDWPARTMNNHFFVNTQAGYRDNAGQVGRFNAARAQQLLDQAGWRRQGAVRRKGGRTLELRMVIPAGVPVSKREGELVQNMLAKVGVRVEVRTVPENDFFDKYVNTGDFDLTPFSWLGTPFPISSAYSIYRQPARGPGGELAIQQNYARVGSAAIDRLMAGAQEELNVTRARQMLNQADRLVWELVHSLVLYQRPQITATKANLANFGSFGFKSTVYQDIGFAR